MAGIAHGTVDGYRNGCRDVNCPAPIPCRDLYRRYQGDWSFKRLVDQGVPLDEILRREQADREGAAQRDKEAARAARAAERAAVRGSRPRPARTMKPASESRQARTAMFRADVVRLHGDGLTDAQIAAEVGAAVSSVAHARRGVGLPAIVGARGPARAAREGGHRAARRARIQDLHAAGLTDQEIADELGATRSAVSQARSRLGLQVNRVQREQRVRRDPAPRHDFRADVTRLHSEGLTDQEMGARLDLTSSHVGTLRRGLGLPVNRSARTRWDAAKLQPHGTNACYARGCRQPACVEAHKEYHRAYVKKRRLEGARTHHGTAYGYQLGCKDRSACPGTPTCADASLAAEAARRRAAGIPPKELVDAAPVQAHIYDLVHAGVPIVQIAERSGLTFTIVRKIVHSRGRGRGVVRAVRADRAAAILAVALPERNAA